MKILGLGNHFRVKSLNSPDLEISISRKNLMLTLGELSGGVVGAMVSVPTAVLVAVVIDEYVVQRDEE